MRELLWPDLSPGPAANNFHQALYVARRALESVGADALSVLPLRDEVLALDPRHGDRGRRNVFALNWNIAP